MTLTPNCFARETISIRLREETPCAILSYVVSKLNREVTVKVLINSLCGVGLVVHEEKVKLAGVVDEECLVSRGHHVPRLPVVAVSDLQNIDCQHLSAFVPVPRSRRLHSLTAFIGNPGPQLCALLPSPMRWDVSTHLRHRRLPLEPSPHSVVDALRLPPARVDAFEAVGLMAVEAVRVLLHDRDVLLRGDHLAQMSVC